MAHTEELLAAALAVWGTRELRGRGTVPWTALEEGFETDLTGRTSRPSKTRVYRDGEPITPEAWLKGLAKQGVKRLALAPVGDDDEPRAGQTAWPDKRMLHAFAGTGSVLLVAVGSGESVALRTAVGSTPPTLLTRKDVLAFIDTQPDPAGIRESLLWQDEHNLHITDGRDWNRFVAALRPEHDERLVQFMDLTLSHVDFQRGESQAWWELKSAHKNPDCAWQYAFVELGRAQRLVFAEDVAEQSRLLATALAEIATYARGAPVESGARRWANEFFDPARALLDAAPIPERWRTRLGGAGMTTAALRLFVAAKAADVFGGMGSWNDLGSIQDDPECGRVSGALYVRLQPGLIAAVNATTAP